MKKIKIFLAASKELQHERELFENEIYRKCKVWIDRGVFLHLDIWEDMSTRTLYQSEYNKYVKEADIFILLVSSKVGVYTEEEFEKAFGEFQSKEKPFVFTYFKTPPDSKEDSLADFKEKLSELKHFYTNFIDFNALWNQFNKELDRLKVDGFTENKKAEKIVNIGDIGNIGHISINLGGGGGGVNFGPKKPEPKMSAIEGFDETLKKAKPSKKLKRNLKPSPVEIPSKSSDPLLPKELIKQKQEIKKEVSVNVYAPHKYKPGKSQLIQIWMFLPKHKKKVKKTALEKDDEASELGFENLFIPIEDGADIIFSISSEDIKYSEQKTFTWIGEISCKNFRVDIPSEFIDDKIFFTLEVYVNGMIVGEITFIMKADIIEDSVLKPIGDKAVRFKKAFVSYASKDRVEVLERVQGIYATEVFDIFQDVLDLEPGERWKNRLYEEIDLCDVFFLFWSKAASDSEWVVKELEYAIQVMNRDRAYPLKIQPIIIPPRVNPPSQLSHLHFNDKIVQFIIAEEQIRKSQKKD